MTDQTNTDDILRRQIVPGADRPVEPGLSRRAMIAGMGTALTTAAMSAAIVPALAHEPAVTSADPETEVSPAERLRVALAEFKAAYEAVHSDVTGWVDVATGFSIPEHVPTPVLWSGDARYIVKEGDRQPSYWITRDPRYDDGPERWFRISTGFKGQNERPDFCCPERHLPIIVRKTENGVLA